MTIFVACERELFEAVLTLFLLFLGMGNNVVEHATVFVWVVGAMLAIVKYIQLSGLGVHVIAYVIEFVLFFFELLSSFWFVRMRVKFMALKILNYRLASIFSGRKIFHEACEKKMTQAAWVTWLILLSLILHRKSLPSFIGDVSILAHFFLSFRINKWRTC